MNHRRSSLGLFCGLVVAFAVGCGSDGAKSNGNVAGATALTPTAGGRTSGTGGVAAGGITVANGAGGIPVALGGTGNNQGGTVSTLGGSVNSVGGNQTQIGGASALGGTTGSNVGGAGGLGGANAGGARNLGGANAGTNASGGSSGTSGAANAATGGLVVGGPRWVGRVDATNASAVRFAWQGAGFLAVVAGSTIAVKLRTESTNVVYFQPVIDGTPGTRFKVDSGTDQVVTLAANLTDSDHVVELYRETEGMYGLSTFLGFTTGNVKGAPAATGRRIEVVGDSISAGYGNLGSEPHPNWVATPACTWTAENSSWFATYVNVAGRALKAEVSTIARSGWGMVRDNNGNTSGVLSSVYENVLGTGNASPWSFEPKVAVVIVNLGTNDWAKGDPGAAYEAAYVTFIAKLRSHYPDAWIFLTIGSMLGDPALTQAKTRLTNVIATVRATAVDTKLATFDFGSQNMGSDGTVPTGCDWHPNVADHQRMAGILQQQLSAKLGW